MAFKLVVVHPFHGHAKGEVIYDQETVAELLAPHSHLEKRVVKVTMTAAEEAQHVARLTVTPAQHVALTHED
jgi:hypothetical protein